MDPYYYENHSKNSRGLLWGTILFALGFLLSFATPTAEAAVSTKIVAINGKYEINHENTINVYNGDVISLMADQVDIDVSGNAQGMNTNADTFMWNTDISSTDFCAPAWQDCYGTNFQTHEYGVNFYVPANMPEVVTVTVINRNDGSFDQVKLHNAGARYANDNNAGGYYDDNKDFDYNQSLQPHGKWVYIGGERVFVPYNYVDNWTPYQNGYWYWTSYGWTWYSYDPWGWVTDHYGYWRHHGTYGWIWLPFGGADFTWHPCAVSFYHSSYGVSWSPYYSGYSHGYHHGYNDGYNDGYWDGYNAALNSHYHHGTTYVSYNNFTNVNIVNVHVTNVTVIQNHFTYVSQNATYGPTLGGIRGNPIPRDQSLHMITAQGIHVNETPVSVIPRPMHGGGTVSVVRPTRPVEIPSQYAPVQGGVRGGGSHIPVGSHIDYNSGVVKPPASHAPAPVRGDGSVVPPTGSAPRPFPGKFDPNQPVNPGRPTRPEPTRPTPAPSRPEPTRPTPAPSRPEPTRPSPAPSRPTPAPAPSRPEPTRPSPAPSRPTPAPAPSRPEPTRPSPAPSRPSPAPSRPSPAPSRPSPAPSRPSPAPSRPSPAPSRPSPAPSRPSPAPSRPSPAPSRPSPAPSRPSPAPSHPSPGRPMPPRGR